MSAVVSIYIYHHTPSGQSRLYRVTQLRTDGVHCRESVVSKHNHCCTAAVHTVGPLFPPTYVCTNVKSLVYTAQYHMLCFKIYRPFPPSRLIPAHTSVKSEMNTVQYHPLCPNIVTAVLLLYILGTSFPPPNYTCQYVKSLVYTAQYHTLCFKAYR